MSEATDEDRYPTLSDKGRATLRLMREHPAAPRFTHASGNRLRASDLDSLAIFERDHATAAVPPIHGAPPGWLDAFVADAFVHVPHYRALGAPPRRFEDIPTTSRADLAADVARFVPDGLPLDRLIHFQTTGTTGHPLILPSHPLVAGRYLTFHRRALRRFGIEPVGGAGRVAIVLLGHQERCFTYTSVTPQTGESGLAKINLHPGGWASPGDRVAWLEAMAPEFIAGDPLSFSALLTLPVALRPRAMLSVSMMLSPGMREALSTRFDCPVLDIYSLNEVGPVAVFDPAVDAHVLLQPRLYVEILRDDGQQADFGEPGEIVVTGGFNDYLPLVRYRTGDYARAGVHRGEPVLRAFSGRPPVRFRRADGQWVNNVDVTHALGHLPLSHFRLHQFADGTLALTLPAAFCGSDDEARVPLQRLLGDLPVSITRDTPESKPRQYTTDLTDDCP
jgi:phenylacetate-CoA ligase